MRDLSNYLKNKSIDNTKLTQYGFIKNDNKFVFNTKIHNSQFEMIVIFSKQQNISKLIDITNEEEYVLVDIQDSTGEFVGTLREEYEKKLKDIIEKCTNINVFKSKQTKEIIKYVEEKYNSNLEYLWENFPENAICRNVTNNKWYLAILTVSERRFGVDSDKIIEVIDLRYQKDKIEDVIDNEKIYPGYHMNKKSWITIKLDNSVDMEKIFELIDNSYSLTVSNKCRIMENELSKKVYEYLTSIPKGKVVTYKQVAEYLGNKGLARVVGNILHKNPDGDKYPCYKVLNSKGELAESFVFGGKNVQKERLENDGIKVENNKVDLNEYQWKK